MNPTSRTFAGWTVDWVCALALNKSPSMTSARTSRQGAGICESRSLPPNFSFELRSITFLQRIYKAGYGLRFRYLTTKAGLKYRSETRARPRTKTAGSSVLHEPDRQRRSPWVSRQVTLTLQQHDSLLESDNGC